MSAAKASASCDSSRSRRRCRIAPASASSSGAGWVNRLPVIGTYPAGRTTRTYVRIRGKCVRRSCQRTAGTVLWSGAEPLVELVEQLAGAQLERSRDLQHGGEPRVFVRALDLADVLRAEAGLGRERLLREVPFATHPAHRPPEG